MCSRRGISASLHTYKRLCNHKSRTLILIALFISAASGLNPYDPKEYDPYLRPNHGAVADICNVSLKMVSIMDINKHNNMELSMNFMLTRSWTDPRLQNLVAKETVFIQRFPHKIWIPDVYVINADIHQREESMRRTFWLKPEGEVVFSERLVARVSCPTMSFMKFPFDKYDCDIKLQSIAYNLINLDMVWNGLITEDDIQVADPEFYVHSIGQRSFKETLGDGQHATLLVHLVLRRSGLRVMTHAIIPLTVLALLAYLTLFLRIIPTPRSESLGEDASQNLFRLRAEFGPVQVQIIRLVINGFTMALTTLVAQLHFSSAPKTATVTALDVWCSVISAIVVILFIHNFTTLISSSRMNSGMTKESEDNDIKLSNRIEVWLKIGVPIFVAIFTVIFFAACLT